MVKAANSKEAKEQLTKYITENKALMTEDRIVNFASKHNYSISHIRAIVYGTQSGSMRVLNPLKSYIEKLQVA